MNRRSLTSYFMLFSLTLQAAAATTTSTTPTTAFQVPAGDAQEDRSGAQAAAAASAAASGLSCIMLMNEARKETNPSEKRKLMAMAMAQCAQSAASQMAANQNGDGAKKVAAVDMPQNPNMGSDQKYDTDPKPLPPTTTADDSKGKDTGGSTNDSPDPEVTEFTIPKITPNAPAPNRNSNPFTTASREPGTRTLDPIEASGIKFLDKESNITKTAAGGFGTVNLSANKGTAALDAAALNTPNGKYVDVPPIFPGSVPLVANAEGGEAKDSNAGDSAFDALMSQIMGGGAAAAEAFGFGAGNADISFLPFDKATNTQPNIFQYASFRYTELSEKKEVERLKKPSGFKVSVAK